MLESIGRYDPTTRITAVNGFVTWGPHDPRGGVETAAIAVVEAAPGAHWSQVELTVECEATARAVGSEIMLLPDYLPLPVMLANTVREAAPLIRLSVDSSLAPLIRGGIPYDAGLPWNGQFGPTCQLALALGDSLEPTSNGEELQSVAVQLADSLGSYLGRPVETPLFIIKKSPEGLARIAGFILGEDRYKNPDGGTFGDYAPLVQHLLRIWWGGGCRVGGPQGEKIEATIRLAIMMHLGCRSERDSEIREALLRDFEEQSQFSLAARLCRQLGAGSREGLGPIRQMTSAWWGKWIPERVVLEALAPALNELR